MSRQLWLVTGASSGLGESCARQALALGHSVAVMSSYRSRLTTISAAFALLVSGVVGAAPPPPGLWGIYGRHTAADCPLFHRGHAEGIVAVSKKDLRPLLARHGVTEIVDRGTR